MTLLFNGISTKFLMALMFNGISAKAILVEKE